MKTGGGESARFAELYDANFGRIFNYVLRRLGDVYLAEDLTGDVFYKALKYSSRLTTPGNNPLPWLYTVACNEVNSYLRKRRAKSVDPVVIEESRGDAVGPDEEVLRAEEELEKQELFAEVRKKMLNLSEEDQTMLSLRYFEELSYADIAKVMGKREGTLRVRLHRAIQALKMEMEGDNHG
jgi:RNA polymerase sigma-70 factor (ECF subfamily)